MLLHHPPDPQKASRRTHPSMADYPKQRRNHTMPIVAIPIFLLSINLLSSFTSAEISAKVGVNYGQLGNNLPTPTQSVNLIKKLKAGRVKLYDANPQILKALARTNLQVSVMVPNEIIANISSNHSLARQWIRTNVVPFHPHTKIRYVLVGNEILSFPNLKPTVWPALVPAIRQIKHALKSFNITNVKVGTTVAMDCLESSFPPSSGKFRADIASSVMKPMLQFLHKTKSFFFLDVYPYFPWSTDPKNIRLDYALFAAKNFTYTDPVTNLKYTNLLDQMLDAVHFAMVNLGYGDVRIWIAETGWPNGCDYDQIGGNVYNAAAYNRNLVKRLTSKPPLGTPARPGVVLPTFIFSLYNENLKGGPGTERHWGLYYPNGTSVYEIELNGETPETKLSELPPPQNNEAYKGKIWCVAAPDANLTLLGDALTYACGQGNGTCDPIQPGRACYKPNSLKRHASYAFSSYWSQFRKSGGTCSFNGLAVQTIKDPSYGACKFPSVILTA
uniref:glucan endo-1,3-beta-D-glucosidase n=1 Tax=Kalanchoe fedtschenkoi TaxID=63787 RepID=A0A7N0ZZA0_KALFE